MKGEQKDGGSDSPLCRSGGAVKKYKDGGE